MGKSSIEELRALWEENPHLTTVVFLLPYHFFFKQFFPTSLLNPLVAGYFENQFSISTEMSNVADGTMQACYFFSCALFGFYTSYFSRNYSNYETMQLSNYLYVVFVLIFSVLWIDSVADALTFWPTAILMTLTLSGIAVCDAVAIVKINAVLLKIKEKREYLYYQTQAFAFIGLSVGPAAANYLSALIYESSGGKAWIVWVMLAAISSIAILMTSYLPAEESVRPREAEAKKVALPSISGIVYHFPGKYWYTASILFVSFTMYANYQVSYFLWAQGTDSSLHERGWDQIFAAQILALTLIFEGAGFFLFSAYLRESYFETFGKSGGLIFLGILVIFYCFFLATVIMTDAPTGWIVAGLFLIILLIPQTATVEILMAMVSDNEDDEGALERRGPEVVEAFFALYNFIFQASEAVGSVYAGVLYHYIGYGGILLTFGSLMTIMLSRYYYLYHICRGERGSTRERIGVKPGSDGLGEPDETSFLIV